MTRQHETPLVPPLGEATVTDWIRQHMARAALPASIDEYNREHQVDGLDEGLAYCELCTQADDFEVDLAARSKMLDAFHDARARLASFTLCAIGDRDRAFRDARFARLRIGHLRYGVCGVNRYDAIGSCLRRLEEYAAPDGGNLEHLVDIANLCEIEYWWPQKEGTGWTGCDPEMGGFQAACWEHLHLYRGANCLTCLAHAVNLCEAEYIAPTHPNAHWEAQDCGGHWSLRNQEGTP